MGVKDPRFADKRVLKPMHDLIDYDGIKQGPYLPTTASTISALCRWALPATLPNPGYKLNVDRSQETACRSRVSRMASRPLSACCPTRPFINIATPACNPPFHSVGIEAQRAYPVTGNQVYGAMRDRNFEIIVGRGGGALAPEPHTAACAGWSTTPSNADGSQADQFPGLAHFLPIREINAPDREAEVEKKETKKKQNRDVSGSAETL